MLLRRISRLGNGGASHESPAAAATAALNLCLRGHLGRSCSDFTKSHFVARAVHHKYLNQNEAENENRVGHLTLSVKCLYSSHTASVSVGVCQGS